jgi:hypothetical protein
VLEIAGRITRSSAGRRPWKRLEWNLASPAAAFPDLFPASQRQESSWQGQRRSCGGVTNRQQSASIRRQTRLAATWTAAIGGKIKKEEPKLLKDTSPLLSADQRALLGARGFRVPPLSGP